MKISKNHVAGALTYLVVFLLAASLQACVSMATPESTNERLASMEIGYQEVLKTATRWRSEGRLSDEQAGKFSALFDDYERSRNAARAALDLADLVTADAGADRAAAALVTLRNLIAEIEQ